ncbi:MAG: hypothetical protein ACYC27_20585 [Armatimonadota bacterium]
MIEQINADILEAAAEIDTLESRLITIEATTNRINQKLDMLIASFGRPQYITHCTNQAVKK